MTRTNIELDDALIDKAMEIHALTTKREVVQLALERLVGPGPMDVAEQLSMRGIGWHGDLDSMRGDRNPEWSERATR